MIVNDNKSKICYTHAILTYGSIFFDKSEWKTIEVPLSEIISIKPSADELHKLEVKFINDNEYGVKYFNSVSFR